MQVLKYIEDKFENLPLRIKVELFLFPLALLGLIYYFIFNKEIKKEELSIIRTIDLKNIKMKETTVDILKQIEKFSKDNNIYLDKITNTNASIKFEATASLKNRLKLLNYLENYNSFSKINFLNFYEENFIVEVQFNKFYKKVKKSFSLDFIDENSQNLDLKLEAIIANKAYINKKWMKIGDKYKFYELIKIFNDKVLLSNKYEQIELKLYKDENN